MCAVDVRVAARREKEDNEGLFGPDGERRRKKHKREILIRMCGRDETRKSRTT